LLGSGLLLPSNGRSEIYGGDRMSDQKHRQQIGLGTWATYCWR
jgi:hypothetical protein